MDGLTGHGVGCHAVDGSEGQGGTRVASIRLDGEGEGNRELVTGLEKLDSLECSMRLKKQVQ